MPSDSYTVALQLHMCMQVATIYDHVIILFEILIFVCLFCLFFADLVKHNVLTLVGEIQHCVTTEMTALVI